MKSQQNPITQIFVGVSITVLSAFLVWKFGFDKQQNPTPPQKIEIIIPEKETGNGSIEVRTPYQDPEVRYINATVSDRLGIDQYGWGQVAESLSIEIDGNVQTIDLSAMGGKMSGSVRFKLPKDGFYQYEIRATTIFNNHHYYDQPCTHHGYGQGKVYIEDGKAYEVIMDPNTINYSTYKIMLQEM